MSQIHSIQTNRFSTRPCAADGAIERAELELRDELVELVRAHISELRQLGREPDAWEAHHLARACEFAVAGWFAAGISAAGKARLPQRLTSESRARLAGTPTVRGLERRLQILSRVPAPEAMQAQAILRPEAARGLRRFFGA